MARAQVHDMCADLVRAASTPADHTADGGGNGGGTGGATNGNGSGHAAAPANSISQELRVSPAVSYLVLYAIIHEVWHTEDLIHTRNVHQLPPPTAACAGAPSPLPIGTTAAGQPFASNGRVASAAVVGADVHIPGGRFCVGAEQDEQPPLVLDCEKCAPPPCSLNRPPSRPSPPRPFASLVFSPLSPSPPLDHRQS
jgi:hypothetical protein